MRITLKYTLVLLTATMMLAGCTSAPPADSSVASQVLQPIPPKVEEAGPTNVYYEVFVRSFADSNGDGIGDLNGLTDKLDYLDRLGIDGLWLMPIQPSPSYHGYDVTDYYGINPEYGTLDDFKRLIAEAHKRDIRILMDLVVNHTSVEHPWFVDSAKDKESPYRDWYTWADDAESAKPSDGATGNAAWHPSENGQYLGIFWEGMPDLNFDNPKVREEMISIGQYWLKEGVDGFRLDAAKHIFGDFRSTIATPAIQGKNKAWWQEFRQGLNTVNPDAYLVGEVWDGAAIIAPYLDNALDSAFNFDLAGTLLSTAASEKASSIGFTLSRIHEFFGKTSNGKFVDAPFLSNHDQTRVMSAVGDNVDHAKMAASLLLTMPGNAFLYYGEELGVRGMKPDERLREPFPWTREEGTPGQTTWEASMYRDKEASVEAEEESPDSLLNHYRTLISWRSQEKALREGTIGSYDTDNTYVTSYIRASGDDQVLVLHNMSKEPQTLTLHVTEAQPTMFSKLVLTNNQNAKFDNQVLAIPAYTTVILKP
ncbi:alpha-amylase family glycosyl hydrolase [Cohnella sp. WQ 127256]|uniref:alpha-amylase family glycosyl hydrolase n=1 Tax=Cohnella sp. WQ 127256 TaxID=2938790 RepID=UPI002119A876|nr:alpha-amylase family glycosyl hydrolase [Cohnella sp. WQ 127256]